MQFCSIASAVLSKNIHTLPTFPHTKNKQTKQPQRKTQMRGLRCVLVCDTVLIVLSSSAILSFRMRERERERGGGGWMLHNTVVSI